MKKHKFLFTLLMCFSLSINAQQVTPASDQVKALTPESKGERFTDGRPKVPDKLLQRLKAVRLEEAWGILRNKGYQNQFGRN